MFQVRNCSGMIPGNGEEVVWYGRGRGKDRGNPAPGGRAGGMITQTTLIAISGAESL